MLFISRINQLFVCPNCIVLVPIISKVFGKPTKRFRISSEIRIVLLLRVVLKGKKRKMASLYLGIRLPEKPFERLKLTNIDLITKNVADLKIEAEKLLNFPHKELGKCS